MDGYSRCFVAGVLVLAACQRSSQHISFACDQYVVDSAAPPSQLSLQQAPHATLPVDSSSLTVRAVKSRDSSIVGFELWAQLLAETDTISFTPYPARRIASVIARPGQYRIRIRCFSCERVDHEWKARPGFADTLSAFVRVSRSICDAPAP